MNRTTSALCVLSLVGAAFTLVSAPMTPALAVSNKVKVNKTGSNRPVVKNYPSYKLPANRYTNSAVNKTGGNRPALKHFTDYKFPQIVKKSGTSQNVKLPRVKGGQCSHSQKFHCHVSFLSNCPDTDAAGRLSIVCQRRYHSCMAYIGC